MNACAVQRVRDEATTGMLNYLDAAAEPALYRNGEVLTRRDPDGSDGGSKGVNLEERKLTVHDGRHLHANERRTVSANGFESIEVVL